MLAEAQNDTGISGIVMEDLVDNLKEKGYLV